MGLFLFFFVFLHFWSDWLHQMNSVNGFVLAFLNGLSNVSTCNVLRMVCGIQSLSFKKPPDRRTTNDLRLPNGRFGSRARRASPEEKREDAYKLHWSEQLVKNLLPPEKAAKYDSGIDDFTRSCHHCLLFLLSKYKQCQNISSIFVQVSFFIWSFNYIVESEECNSLEWSFGNDRARD